MGNTANTPTSKPRLPFLLVLLANVIFIAVLFFLSAGSLAWIQGWIVASIMFTGNVVGTLLIDPEMLQKPAGAKSGDRPDDALLASIMGRLGPIVIIITSGLDFRFGWSEPFPPVLAILGLIFFTLGDVLTLWATKENRFFSSVVLIQKERGHHVITTGPYRIVRHPGYLGSIIFLLAMPFALASYWALIPAVITIIVSFVRTDREDNTLKRELEGYSRYAERVRYRIIPGVW